MGPSFEKKDFQRLDLVMYETQYEHSALNTTPNNVVLLEYRHIFVSTDLINIA